MKPLRTHGFTLIEIVLVLALVAVIASFGAAMSLSSFSRSTVIQERDLFVSLLLRGARAKAMANIDNVDHGIYIDNDCHRYILFADSENFTAPTDCEPRDSRQIDFTSDTIEVHISNGSDTLVFEQLSGNVTDVTNTITITISNGDREQTLTISEVGQIDW